MIKRIFILTCTLSLFCGFHKTPAQTVEEIVSTYVETIGGMEAWNKIDNMVVTGVGRQQGIDYPFVATYMKDGRYVIDVDLQGNSFIIEAYDGNRGWFTNFQTQKAEAADSETSTNLSHSVQDQLVSPFFNYEKKGYQIELLGTENLEGSDLYKLKITKQPLIVNGETIENVEIYYFDMDNLVPISAKVIRQPINPIQVGSDEIVFSDYQEVDGKYMPFTQTEKFNGVIAIEMIIEKVTFNAEIDETIFNMPTE